MDIVWWSVAFLRAVGVIGVIVVIIFVHELGHYLIARWCGIGATTFSIGFGPEIFGFTDSRGTRWRIALVPLGGYIKFVGDDNVASLPSMTNIQVSPPDSFASATAWRRAATSFAGPLFNGLFTILVLAFFFMTHDRIVVAPVIGGLQQDMPAAAAGLQIGDRIKAVNGTRIDSFEQLSTAVGLHAGDRLKFDVIRQDKTMEVEVSPVSITRDDGFGHKLRVGAIGINAPINSKDATQLDPQFVSTIHYNIAQAIAESIKQSATIVGQTFFVVKRIFQGREDRCQLSGPTKTANIAWQVSKSGFLPLLQLAAILSIGIGLINLLPIPPLDGGHCVLYLVEGVFGKPLSLRVQEVFFKLGVFLVFGFMLFAIINDYFPCS